MEALESPTSGSRSWIPGKRVARLRSSHSYGYVLVLLLVSFVFTAAGPDEAAWGQSVLALIQCATLAVAIWTAGLGRTIGLPTVVLVVIAVAVAVAQLLSGSDALIGSARILNAILLAVVAIVIGIGVFDQPTINGQSILGAICIYLLIGMMFTFIYGAMASLDSGHFFAQETDGTPSLRLYFSFVTLTTVGYGDYSAASDLGHMIAIVEALVGQLYLVTVVAVIVGGLSGGARSKRSAGAGESSE